MILYCYTLVTIVDQNGQYLLSYHTQLNLSNKNNNNQHITHIVSMSGHDIELEVWDNGKPVAHSNKQIADKIRVMRQKKDFKGVLELASTLQNTQETYLIRANAYLPLGKWQDVVRCCDAGLELGEQSEFYHLKGKAVGKLGNQRQKVDLIKTAIELNPKIPAYYRNLGASYYALKEYDNAIQCHQKAISLEPNNAINYHNMGAAYLRSERIEDAVVCFDKAIGLDKKLALSHSWKGDCFKKQNMYQRALDCYKQAYKISGNEVYLKEKKAMEEMIEQTEPKKKKFLGLF